ncbi:MAG: 50S ribosomal protein L9 [Planctomycetes bacterium]|nr:50S ribosomal protein L9 [Planctomycetota bacterium]
MARNIELLLLESVENLGIVGDIVKVRAGYARNYLLPHQLAEFPTPSRIEGLQAQRAKAQAEAMHLRGAREDLLERMLEITVTLVRSCNDKGVLYGSVTQRDIADGLTEAGYDVGLRSIRLSNALRHIGEYPVPIQFDKDLRTEITLVIEPDQPLEEREEMEFDDEGNLIEKQAPKPKRERPRKTDEATEAAPAEAAPTT